MRTGWSRFPRLLLLGLLLGLWGCGKSKEKTLEAFAELRPGMNESEVVALLGSPGDKYKGREAMAVLLAAMKKHGGLANPAVTLRVKYPPAFDALPKGEQKADASDSWTYGPYTGEEQTEKGKRRTETSLGVFFLDGKLTEARKHQILTAW